MESIEEFTLYFYIACGVALVLHLLSLMLICVLFVKLKRVQRTESNQLNRQTNMMSDFCYTNPTIVPGEELSRRGFSMYCGSDNYDEYNNKPKDINYGTYHEALSKF